MQRPDDAALSRNRPFDPKRTCLLLIDTQNVVWNPEVAARLPKSNVTMRQTVLSNLQALVAGFRAAAAEVMFTVMENLTKDGRDRSVYQRDKDVRFQASQCWSRTTELSA